jgi:hypothetical protein
MKCKKIEWACALDSDVLLYTSVQSYFEKNIAGRTYEAGYCIFNQRYDEFRWVASGGVAFISSNFLADFCNYIIDIYKSESAIFLEKLEFHQKSRVPGGIADMTLLYLYDYFHNSNILNLLIPIEGEVFNNGIHYENNIYKAILNKFESYAIILFKGKKPYFLNQNQEKIFFQCLHFQGGFKNQILQFYTGKSYFFILKLRAKNILNSVKAKIRLHNVISKLKMQKR